MLSELQTLAITNTENELDRDWSAVGASSVGMLFSLATLTLYPFGVFILPLGREFGWTRGQMSGAHAISAPALIVGSLLWGALLDRWGGRRTILCSIAGLGLGIASFSLLAKPLWHFYLLFAFVPLIAGAASPLGYSGVLVRRFSKRLGLAIGLSLTGIGLGAAIVPPLAQALITRCGWRNTYVILGILAVLVGVPSAIIATRHSTGPAGRIKQQSEVSVVPLIRTRAFILICVTFFLLSTASIGTLTHLVPMMIDRGFTPVAAARLAGLTGLSTLVSSGLIGWLMDRIHAPYVLCVSSLCLCASCLLLAYRDGHASSAIAAVILGLFVGSEVDYITFLIRKYFGRAAFGRLYGLAFSAFVLGPGGVLLGYAFDHFHRYGPGLAFFAVLSLLAAILALAMPRYDQAAVGELI